MELQSRINGPVVECIDNDETASVIASIVSARILVILSSVDGIYMDPADPGNARAGKSRRARRMRCPN